MLPDMVKAADAPDSVDGAITACTGQGVGRDSVAKINADVAQTNRVSPKKLLLSKWTAVHPERKEKHFLVTKVFEPEILGQAIVEIELEAAMTGRKVCMPWRELKSREHWRQGWL
jgi:tryptophan-rich hypothetical protein